VNPIPIISAIGDTICLGNFATITASGASNYLWSNGSVLNPTTVNPVSTTTYTVTGTELGCTGTAIATVNVSTPINLGVNGPFTICDGSSVNLTANGANTYLWNTGEITNSIIISPNSTTTYTVTGTSGGCIDIETILVTVIPTPTIIITTSNDTICSGSSVMFTASGAISYVWSNAATTSSIIVSPTFSTTYSVTGTSGGCSAVETASVIVVPTPIIVITTNDETICSGTSAVLIANGASNYVWDNGSTLSSIMVSPDSTTTYTVTGTSGGCSESAVIMMTVYAIPTVDSMKYNMNGGVAIFFGNFPGKISSINVNLMTTYFPLNANDSVGVFYGVVLNDGDIIVIETISSECFATFTFSTVGIQEYSTVIKNDANTKIFNLLGQEVKDKILRPGIYIRGGKKFFVAEQK